MSLCSTSAADSGANAVLLARCASAAYLCIQRTTTAAYTPILYTAAAAVVHMIRCVRLRLGLGRSRQGWQVRDYCYT
eukprot:16493-Heterococcus_DN1.PRE.7